LNLQRRLSGLMGKKRIDVSPLKPHANPSATPLLVPDSGSNAGESGEARTRVRAGPLNEGHGTNGKGVTMPQMMLIETSQPIVLELTEARGAAGTGKMVARGEFGRCGVPTMNGRIYSEALMGREIKRLTEDLKARRVLGQLDHPSDGRSSLKAVSHVITNLWIEADGRVMGEAEILNTTEGKNLRALVEARIPVPVSSRGFGSTKPATGKQEGEDVQDDFVLKTYDFVADPAVRTAVPTITMESVDDSTAAALFLAEFPEVACQLQDEAVAAVEKAKGKVVAAVDAAVGSAEAQVRSEMAEAFEARLAASLLEAREDLGQQLREEFAADPGVGAAKATLAQIAEMVGVYRTNPDERAARDALKAADLKAAQLTKERDEAVEEARQAGLHLMVERQLRGAPMAEAVRDLLSGVKFEDEADVEVRLRAIQEHLPEMVVGPTEEEAQLREEIATLRGEVLLAQEKAVLLDDKLRRAVELGQRVNAALAEAETRAEEAEAKLLEEQEAYEKRLQEVQAESLEVYKAAKVAGLANGRAVLGLMEDVTSRADVDAVVMRNGKAEVADSELREMRRKIQRGHGDARELSEDQGRKPRVQDTDEFGVPFGLMRQLAGYQE